MSEETQRRLTTIVAADIVGFSRLVGIDEEATLAAQRDHRSELIEPLLVEHHGRIANTAGDSFLFEFRSAVEAVRCSVAVQDGMAERNRNIAADRRIEYRIGINVGDVVADGDDLLGDGVNIAARLENICTPGGIILSDDAYRQVRDRLDIAWEDGGEHKVKNIARPVQVWRWGETAKVNATALTGAPLPLPDKPSIAVLPFDNMSGDPEQEYFSDGLTEDIITGLSRMRWLMVIARNTTFAYKGQAGDVSKVGKELGVRYVLEGSVRRGGDQVRITAQLIEARTGSHIWAERYDRKLTDIFALQDEITETIISTINPELTLAEINVAKHKRAENLDSWDLYLRALPLIYQMELEANERAIELLEKAVVLDTGFSTGHAWLSWCHTQTAIFGRRNFASDALASAQAEARKALDLNSDNPLAYVALAWFYIITSRAEESVAAAVRALELDPNFAMAQGSMALALAAYGEADAAIDAANKALRGSPRDPLRWAWFQAIANAHFAAGRYGEAYDFATQTARLKPGWLGCHLVMAASAAHLDRMDEAHAAMQIAHQIQPRLTQRGMRKSAIFNAPDVAAAYASGLAKAGLPE